MAKYDAIVVGLGIMGTAALSTLARRGARVLGIERFAPGHDKGSSHGETRVIRLGYFEHPSYVPLLRSAYELWRELEAASGQELLRVTGIAEIGPPDGAVVPGTLLASRTHGLPHEVLKAAALMERFPAFRIPPGFVGVVQPDGGFVAVETAIEAQLALARAAGAEVGTGMTVDSIESSGDGASIEIGPLRLAADTVIVAAGPWLKRLLPDIPVQVRVTRQVMAWFEPRDAAAFAAGRFPVFVIESRHGVHYGFPPRGSGGVKVAKHHHGNETVDPDRHDRTVSAADESLIRSALAEHIPAANGKLLAAKTCLYTVTPDGDFIIDRMPGAPNVIVASPCSGHGFKFAPVVGEILADLATAGTTRHDISRFRIGRFSS
ncbi:MAG TPA: N-methyl-L-tryptophan oxidase [Burkholderiales bacterium]|nr:N-methyl-L-tryptophan oxidase [Burkholderiales bacterium]